MPQTFRGGCNLPDVPGSQVVKFLVEQGARISAKDDAGETSLMKACLLAGRSLELGSAGGQNPGKGGHTDIIKFLIDSQLMQRNWAATSCGILQRLT